MGLYARGHFRDPRARRTRKRCETIVTRREPSRTFAAIDSKRSGRPSFLPARPLGKDGSARVDLTSQGKVRVGAGPKVTVSRFQSAERLRAPPLDLVDRFLSPPPTPLRSDLDASLARAQAPSPAVTFRRAVGGRGWS